MRLSGQFQTFLFSWKDLKRTKSNKMQNKQFLPFCAHEKLLPLLFSVCFFFLFFSWFRLDLRFCALKIYSKKKKNRLRIVLIASFTILRACTPTNPPIENLFVHTYFYLWSSVRISPFYKNLFESFLSVRISS